MNDYLIMFIRKQLLSEAYYANTLPWGIEGTMLLPSANYLNFMTEFSKAKAEWQTLVDSFWKLFKAEARCTTLLG